MTPVLKNDRFLRALRREPVDCTPVWLMRQAGRYLPEYRATRAKAGSFLAMAKNPDIACEVTLQPLERFDLDAAILFSDILTVPDAMGLGLYFVEGEGPKFERPISSAADVARLGVPDMEDDLGYVMDAVRVIGRELDGKVPLIGFSGSPWTLACYMVQGGGSKDFAKIKAMALNEPATLHKLLEVTTDAVIAYLAAQRAAGAQALQVFDTWGGVLSPAMYREFSLRYLQRIAAELERGDGAARTPLILFGKGTGQYLESTPAPTASVLTGPSAWIRPRVWPPAASRCRATSTRPPCTATRRRSSAKLAARWMPTVTAMAARARAMCSTLATACRRT
jgi:uroporphyrinogen decarboxylase